MKNRQNQTIPKTSINENKVSPMLEEVTSNAIDTIKQEDNTIKQNAIVIELFLIITIALFLDKINRQVSLISCFMFQFKNYSISKCIQ